jgi:hypothetical protein
MSDQKERRSGGERRKRPLRRGERRKQTAPVPKDRRAGKERRQRERRTGKDRRRT